MATAREYGSSVDRSSARRDWWRCDLAIALEGLPVGGVGGVDELRGRGTVSGKIGERCDRQILVATLLWIPVAAQIAQVEIE